MSLGADCTKAQLVCPAILGERLGSGCRISSPAGLTYVYSPSLNSVPRMPPRFNQLKLKENKPLSLKLHKKNAPYFTETLLGL